MAILCWVPNSIWTLMTPIYLFLAFVSSVSLCLCISLFFFFSVSLSLSLLPCVFCCALSLSRLFFSNLLLSDFLSLYHIRFRPFSHPSISFTSDRFFLFCLYLCISPFLFLSASHSLSLSFFLGLTYFLCLFNCVFLSLSSFSYVFFILISYEFCSKNIFFRGYINPV